MISGAAVYSVKLYQMIFISEGAELPLFGALFTSDAQPMLGAGFCMVELLLGCR